MANPKLLTKLYQRMNAEQEQYRNWLLGQSPGDILNHAAAYAVREDIVMEMSALTEEECAAVVEIARLRNHRTEIELEAAYFRGCYDSVGYLKKAGIL